MATPRNCFTLFELERGLYGTVESFMPEDAKKVVAKLRAVGYKGVTASPECMGCELWTVQVRGGPGGRGQRSYCVRGVIPRKSSIGP